ncbi:MAG: hypothetical protein RR178_00005, partial [Gordonibacter sp.]
MNHLIHQSVLLKNKKCLSRHAFNCHAFAEETKLTVPLRPHLTKPANIRKYAKKLGIAGLLTLLVAFASLCCTTPASAEQLDSTSQGIVNPYRSLFPSNTDQLKSDYYLKSELFKPYSSFSYTAPYHAYCAEMSKSASFGAEVITWKTLNFIFNPDELVSGLLEKDILSEQGYYEIALFDMLQETQSSNSLLDQLDTSIKKCNADVYRSLFKQLEGDPLISADSLDLLLTEEQKAKIGAALYAEPEGSYISVFGTIDTFQKLINSSITIRDMVNRVGTMMAVQDLSDSTVTVLRSMREYCDQEGGSFIHLTRALDDLICLYENNFSAKVLIAEGVLSPAVDKILSKVSSTVWSKMLDNLPGAGWAKLAYTVGKAASNVWISSDARIEKYFEMKTLLDIEFAVKDSLTHYREIYQKNPSEKNAQNFNAAVEMAIGTYDLGLRYSSEYWTILDEMGLNTVLNEFGEGWSHNNLIEKASTDRMKINEYYRMADTLLTEISLQGTSQYKSLYETPFSITNQFEFDSYCLIENDIRSSMKNHRSNLKIRCMEDVTLTTQCNVGSNSTFKEVVFEENGSLASSNYISFEHISLNGKNTISVPGGTLSIYSLNCAGAASITALNVLGSGFAAISVRDHGFLDVKAQQTTLDVLSSEGLTQVRGNLSITNTGINNDGSLTVDGNLEILQDLRMDSPRALIHVGGVLALFKPSFLYTTGGTIELEGDLAILGESSYHLPTFSKVVFCGDGLQTVRPQEDSIDLGIVEFKNPSVTIDGAYSASMTLGADSSLSPQTPFKVGELNMNGCALSTAGPLEAAYVNPQGAASVTAPDVRVTSSATVGKGESLDIHAPTASIEGLSVEGLANIRGDASVSGIGIGGGGSLTVDGNLEVLQQLRMDSPEDLLHVGGDLDVRALIHLSSDTGGTVELEGDLAILGHNKYNSQTFRRVVFCGDGLQTVRPQEDSIDLGIVEFKNPSVTIDGAYSASMTLGADSSLSPQTPFKVGELNMNGCALSTAGPLEAAYVNPQGAASVTAPDVRVTSSATVGKGESLDIHAPTASIEGLSVEGLANIRGDASVSGIGIGGGGSLTVDGNLEVLQQLRMDSPEDLLHVGGDLTMGETWQNYVVNKYGTIEIESDLNLAPNSNPLASGEAKVVAYGTKPQTLNGNIGNIVNAHRIEEDVLINSDYPNNYVWDPDYRRTDKHISFASFEPINSFVFFTGNSIEPVLEGSYNQTPLYENQNYITSYENNKNAGIASIVISGTNGYKGIKVIDFTILPLDINQADSQPITTQLFSGAPLEPIPALSYGQYELAKNVDYKVTYYNNTDPGEAYAVIEGAGNFINTVYLPFKIVPNAWTTLDDQTYYYENGSPAKGERLIEGNWYHFDSSTGAMSVGITTLPDGRTAYYDQQSGKMTKGEVLLEEGWRYFDWSSGDMARGLATMPDGRTLYYNKSGLMQKGEQLLEDGWHYFDWMDGNMHVGLTEMPEWDGRTLYFDEAGVMTKGEVLMDGGWRYFDFFTGDMASGMTAMPDGRTLYYDGSGFMQKGEQPLSDGWYYFDWMDGSMHVGLTEMPEWDGRTLYFDDKGIMTKGEVLMEDGWRCFDWSSGDMARGLTTQPDDRVMYYGEDGLMKTGWIEVDGVQRYFDENGILQEEAKSASDGHDLSDASKPTASSELPQQPIDQAAFDELKDKTTIERKEETTTDQQDIEGWEVSYRDTNSDEKLTTALSPSQLHSLASSPNSEKTLLVGDGSHFKTIITEDYFPLSYLLEQLNLPGLWKSGAILTFRDATHNEVSIAYDDVYRSEQLHLPPLAATGRGNSSFIVVFQLEDA